LIIEEYFIVITVLFDGILTVKFVLSENCFDEDESSCKEVAQFCDIHPPLREVCPRTCGLCDFAGMYSYMF